MTKTLLIIGYVWPEPKSSAAGSRMMQLIYAFQSRNYQITYASPCAKNDNAFDLEHIDVQQTAIEINNSSFDDIIKRINPDIVVFDRFMMEEQFGWRVAKYCPNTLRILDTEDLHALRKGRHQAWKDQQGFDINYLFNEVAKREIASIYRCDLSLIISEAEMDILTSMFKLNKDLLYYLPFMLDAISDMNIKKLPSFSEREHFMSIGNFLHEPNYIAVLYLKETIWPMIKKQLPDAQIHIYGAYASQKVNQLHKEAEGFLIRGFAKDVHEVMRNNKVCLAPLHFGAGLKGKLVDAMQNGTPCVMTSIAAEGMFGGLEPNGFVVDGAEEFAKKAVDLYTKESLWKQMQAFGFEVIKRRFNKEKLQSNFLVAIEALQMRLKQHRQQNFTGQMLQHHSMQSTKYLSRWIEAKNK